uniref:Uncharacterized protein n=1 Tax=Salix viminalis TaxID=40686 RepID=A0A6N2LUI0_SALVM
MDKSIDLQRKLFCSIQLLSLGSLHSLFLVAWMIAIIGEVALIAGVIPAVEEREERNKICEHINMSQNMNWLTSTRASNPKNFEGSVRDATQPNQQ